MKNIKVICAAIIISILSFSCAGVITLKTPKITGGKIEKKKYVPKKPAVLFEDFEAGTVVGGYGYANKAGGASTRTMISNPSNDKAHGGSYAFKAVYDTGTNADWGCGFGFQSAYGGGFIDARDRQYVSLWIKAPQGTPYYIFVNEASANGADGEFWNGPEMLASGEWDLYEVSFDDFYKNIYSGNQDGNNVLDAKGIGTVGAQLGGAQGSGEFLFDDVRFK